MEDKILITDQELEDFLEIHETLVKYMGGETHLFQKLCDKFGREKIVAYTISHFSRAYGNLTCGISAIKHTELFDKNSRKF